MSVAEKQSDVASALPTIVPQQKTAESLYLNARRALVLRWAGVGLHVALWACIALQLLSLYSYSVSNAYLLGLIRGLAAESAPPSEQTIELLAFFRRMPALDNREYYLLPVFDFLASTPREVAERGGDCADRARLLISLLHVRGIHAVKWALYDKDGNAKHAVVEVDTEKGKMAVDALFGLYFPKPGGGYYSVWDLRRNPEILNVRVRELLEQGEQPGAAPLDRYPLDSYIYSNARSINWNKSLAMRGTYQVLHFLIGSRVDRIPRPFAAERPSLMVLIASSIGIVVIVILLIVARWLRFRLRRENKRILHLSMAAG